MPEYNSRKDIKKMIDKYVAGTATDEEISFVEMYYSYQERSEAVKFPDEDVELLQKSGFEKIKNQISKKPERKAGIVKFYKYASAAVLLLSCATAYLFLKEYKNVKVPAVAVHKKVDAAPGSNSAILTLGNGTKIVLNEQSNKKLKELSGQAFIKAQKGQLVYVNTAYQNDHQEIVNNTVTTPKGGQYQVVLPDGTQVWLNAASSLTYPVFFTGSKRVVKLEGEGYFEVAKNKTMPFHVETGNQDVEVTGTHFNINSYMDDSSINTTLLEGRVIIHSRGKTQLLFPTQQASVFLNSAEIKVKTVNTEEEIAWKNGLFQFDNTNLKNILNQLERWYNIKVDYHHLPFKRYNGMISRNSNLSAVLTMLELTGNIKFELEENKVLKVKSN
jgi:transmembrane sensor